MKRLALSALLIPAISLAVGYRVPEQSIRSTGTAASYTSTVEHADSVHFNPANMSFLKDRWYFELGSRLIYLPKIKFKGNVLDPVQKRYVYVDTRSEDETHFVPYFHMVFPEVKNFRFGISFVTPAGLSKRWDDVPVSAYAKRFTLKVYELDFALSYRVNEKFSVGGGLRGVYASGKVKLYYPNVYNLKLDGDTDVKPGYYLSFTFKPTENFNISAVYRSKVDLDIEGDAKGNIGLHRVNTSGDVSVPLPAELRISGSYVWNNTTFELTLERTFWSSYDYLDFNYKDPVAENQFGKPIEKDWEDVNTYRFGLQHKFGDSFKGLLGIAYSESPIPSKSLGFELPEPKSVWILSLGGIYNLTKNWEVGFSYLYLAKDSRKVDNQRIKGEFSDISAHLFTLSVGAKF
ncbi:OmpP1/FadL family transporter [Aquifex aeolicus]|uniref:Transporter n=1 Tax=Aquifex aeolicus (strain VF5) TaxID=224324 RepID=O67110_AQUAE|nr:OmpP1/FadL family transporter [Aquifex aeolicus]AAC07076.1 putative protein [Aquifex aeolicus VF5]